MGKVIPFKQRPEEDPTAVKMLEISDEIDATILRYLMDGETDPRDIAGLLAHRLGNLMKHIGDDEKLKVWRVCSRIMAKQAEVEDAV